jgi:adenosine deaminase CECR1
MRQCIEIKQQFPDLISGYDLVGQEDLGRTLHDLTPELLWFEESCAAAGVNIPFFFHAGECLGDGDETDQNLFDAILFGTRRIGHAFSLYKHPLLIDMVKEKKILVESCPISNEVLRYTASIMSHPLPALLARGVKAALSNDDPALLGQGTSGLTHDFWQALQGWENLGLEGLVSFHSFLRFRITPFVYSLTDKTVHRALLLKTAFAGRCLRTRQKSNG